MKPPFNIVYVAHFVVEATSALTVYSGEKGFTLDKVVVRDSNRLPYIPGTGLAGVVRHSFSDFMEENQINQLFGYQDQKEKEGQGSRIIFSSAHMVGSNGKAIELPGDADIEKDGYLKNFLGLPARDHVRINERGVTNDGGKFDRSLVYKGTRFAFRIELEGTELHQESWDALIRIFSDEGFRIGADTRNGFGRLKVVQCRQRKFDLQTDLIDYLQLSPSLNADFVEFEEVMLSSSSSGKWIDYKFELKPDDFFLFGAGYGEGDLDIVPKVESYFDWSKGVPELKTGEILIPATSIKGAIAHRTAFHYNKLMCLVYENSFSVESAEAPDSQKVLEEIERTIEQDIQISQEDAIEKLNMAILELSGLHPEKLIGRSESFSNFQNQYESLEDNQAQVGEKNHAIKSLFGFSKSDKEGARGKVLISDIYKKVDDDEFKKLDHIRIDRYTGGGINGALYNEEVVATQKTFLLEIRVHESAFESDTDGHVKNAFLKALDDIKKGKLPLGGNVNKGHGTFRLIADHSSNHPKS